MAETSLGYTYPASTAAPAGHSQIQALAEDVDASPGIASMTGAAIAALTGDQKRAGRVVFNSTTGRLQRSDGSTWVDVAIAGDAPTAHAASHAAAGADALTLAQSQVTGLVAALAAIGAMASWSPTLTQGSAVSRTVQYGQYAVVGGLVVCMAQLLVSGSGTAGQGILLPMPVAPTSAISGMEVALGVGTHSSSTFRLGLTAVSVGSSIGFTSVNAATGHHGAVDGFTLASGDVLTVMAAYQRAA